MPFAKHLQSNLLHKIINIRPLWFVRKQNRRHPRAVLLPRGIKPRWSCHAELSRRFMHERRPSQKDARKNKSRQERDGGMK
jgi:hypothetical protein